MSNETTMTDHDRLIKHSVDIEYIKKTTSRVETKMDSLTESCNHKLSNKISWFQAGIVFTAIGVMAAVILLFVI